MDKRYWLTAVVIVLGLLALLAYEPAGERQRVSDGTAAPDIVDLPAVDAPSVATVELQGRATAESATALTTRFERERRDPEWAEAAAEDIERTLTTTIDGARATIVNLECRASVCRVELRAATETSRPELVAAATAALQRAGHETLLERAHGKTATLVIGVRTPRTP